MQGCDNFCAYCVVPHVRGRETSRRPEAILAEVRSAVADGAREITLLGQNVNSYGAKEGLCSFAELLARVNAVEGLARIRFTTSHPKDLTRELIGAFGRLDHLCPHIHLPVQSGSDRILERMNRRYTRAHYLDIISKLRDSCGQIAVTTDMIVGFQARRGPNSRPPWTSCGRFNSTVSLPSSTRTGRRRPPPSSPTRSRLRKSANACRSCSGSRTRSPVAKTPHSSERCRR